MNPAIGKSVSVNGLKNNYLEHGSGKPVVFLHGSGPGVSAHANWARVLEALKADFHVYAPDAPGYGYSDNTPDNQYDMPFWIKNFLGWMDAVGLQSATLVGNSFGGSLSLAVAATAPQRVERLVLMGTPCGKFKITEGLRAARLYEPSKPALEAMLRMFPHDQSLITQEMIDARYEASLAMGTEAFKALVPLDAVNQPDFEVGGVPEKIAARLQQHTLVLHGRDDRVVPVELGIRLNRAIPNSELHVFGNCGHWVQIERHDRFVRMVREFLQN